MFGHRVGVTAALILVLGACGGESEGSKNECTTAADCDAGEKCVGGRCQSDLVACEPACADPTPVCDMTVGTCKTCTARDGCRGATPFCDPDADGGKGVCIGCRTTADCDGSEVCDPQSHTCVGCTETEGCSGDTPICKDGKCVACTAEEGCDAPLLCDLSIKGGECVTCAADGTGCADDQVCDRSIPGGRCVTCTVVGGCEAPQFCDTSVPGGTCVTCLPTAGCTAPAFCDTSVPGGACVTCTADGTGCAIPTPHCDTSVAGGACVACLDGGDCPAERFCDVARKECVVCNDANEGCEEPWPVCDVGAAGGLGACVGCLLDEDCPASLPRCEPTGHYCLGCFTDDDCGGTTPYCSDRTDRCVACRTDDDCGDGQSCFDDACWTTVSLQVQAVRNAPTSASLDLKVDGALVTYIRPAGDQEDAGFFVQADAAGPAVFVAIAPIELSPVPVAGARVSFRVTEKAVNAAGLVEVVAVDGWSELDRGTPLAPFVQDLGAAGDLVSNLAGYEAELIALEGTLVTRGPETDGFSESQFTTAGMTTATEDLLLRVPETLADTLDLAAGCTFRLTTGVMWRDGAAARPTAYRAADFGAIDCPEP